MLDFIKMVFYPRIAREFTSIAAQEKIPYQAIGSALLSEELQKLTRYEAYIDRKYEKPLAILFRLQEIREARERKKLSRRRK